VSVNAFHRSSLKYINWYQYISNGRALVLVTKKSSGTIISALNSNESLTNKTRHKVISQTSHLRQNKTPS
jgi:hypothetical protein